MFLEAVTAQIVDALNSLAPEKQREVLAFTRSLSAQPKGVKGTALLTFAGRIPPADLSQMQEAIEESCECKDADEW